MCCDVCNTVKVLHIHSKVYYTVRAVDLQYGDPSRIWKQIYKNEMSR